jgi:hypothetical protein
MRTERVTLEIRHYDDNDSDSVYRWNWAEMMSEQGLGINESVRVVDETHFDDLAQVAMERAAAIREREDSVAFWKGANACLLEAATRLEELVEERRWVPVGERLPPNEEWVEIAGTWGEGIGYCDGEQWLTTESETFDYLVTHWKKRTPGPEGEA